MEHLWTQQDFDTGYNAAPDYTGGGFSVEHMNFAEAIRARAAGREPGVAVPPVVLGEAVALEQMIHGIYSRSPMDGSKKIPWESALASLAASREDETMDSILEGLRP